MLDGLLSAEAAGFGERVTAWMRALRRARCDDRQRRRSPRARTTVPAFPSIGLLGAAVFNRRFESWVASERPPASTGGLLARGTMTTSPSLPQTAAWIFAPPPDPTSPPPLIIAIFLFWILCFWIFRTPLTRRCRAAAPIASLCCPSATFPGS